MTEGKILLVSATRREIAPLLSELKIQYNSDRKASEFIETPTIDILITGIGQAVTAFHLGQTFSNRRYALAVNAGIAGSFTQRFPIKSVVNVVEQQFADLGAENGDEFLTLFDLKLCAENEFPIRNRRLYNDHLPDIAALKAVPTVRGITVNSVIGSTEKRDQIIKIFNPEIVEMEGASFFYACLISKTPFLELRAISDYVGPRDKSKWDINAAIADLNSFLSLLLNNLMT